MESWAPDTDSGFDFPFSETLQLLSVQQSHSCLTLFTPDFPDIFLEASTDGEFQTGINKQTLAAQPGQEVLFSNDLLQLVTTNQRPAEPVWTLWVFT